MNCDVNVCYVNVNIIVQDIGFLKDYSNSNWVLHDVVKNCERERITFLNMVYHEFKNNVVQNDFLVIVERFNTV